MSNLFNIYYKRYIHCNTCDKFVSVNNDVNIYYEYFQDPVEYFEKLINTKYEIMYDYKCEKCHNKKK